ncbi:hypothetical protein, partial [Actinobacillus pleuropneumoniae]
MEMMKRRGAYVFHLGIPISFSDGKITLNSFSISFVISISAIRSIGMGSPSFPPLVDSSKISHCSPKGSSNSQPPKKREGWRFEVVGIFGRNFPKLSLFL